ncbi:Nucleotide-binding protein [Nymphon striatum]|nr:Nucleotide-binding protein [Nymphon striatum]
MPFECPQLPQQIHATCVSVQARGLLIVGPSGSGKSTLALKMLGMGALLVADDRCDLSNGGTGVIADKPTELPEAIEARGIGLLAARCAGPTQVAAIVDLEQVAYERLPPVQNVEVGPYQLPLLAATTQTDMAAAFFYFLKYGFHGAGRSTAINALEDVGFEAIDNLPLSLVPRLLDGPPLERPVALGVDVRNRDFTTKAFMKLVASLPEDTEAEVSLLYLDTREDVLIRRYSETRRPHPMAPNESLAEGIHRERELLGAIQSRSDVVIDTSDLSPHDLREEVTKLFAIEKGRRLSVLLNSFSYKRGVPHGVDMAFDCRFLRNPHWDTELRDLTGKDPKVVEYVTADERFDPFFSKINDLTDLLLPAFHDEGKSYLTIGLGCTGGKHRSVAVAEMMGKALANKVIVAHGGLAREYLSAVEHVVGKQTGIRAITIEENHDRSDKQSEICSAADSVDVGLHARASAKFVEVVEQFDARVTVCKDGMDVSGDSIMGLLMLAASRGTSIDVRCEGSEAEGAMDSLAELVSDKFGEGH